MGPLCSVHLAQSREADAVMTCNLYSSDQPGFFRVTSNSISPTWAHTPASDPSGRCFSDKLAEMYITGKQLAATSWMEHMLEKSGEKIAEALTIIGPIFSLSLFLPVHRKRTRWRGSST